MVAKKKKIKFIVFFIITFVVSQLLVKLLSPTNFIKSPMYIFLPIVGFIAMYYLTPEIEKYTHFQNKLIYSAILLLLGIFCFYIILVFYFWQIKLLNPNWPMTIPFWKLLIDSAFLEFIIAAILGIFASESKE